MRKINDIQVLRKIQTGILDDIHRFCTEHGIRYFLSSGTLIGAVRHGGYIPWDDDLDLYMPRKDYEHFLASYHHEHGTYKVLNPRREKNYYYTFAKVVDTRTMAPSEMRALDTSPAESEVSRTMRSTTILLVSFCTLLGCAYQTVCPFLEPMVCFFDFTSNSIISVFI